LRGAANAPLSYAFGRGSKVYLSLCVRVRQWGAIGGVVYKNAWIPQSIKVNNQHVISGSIKIFFPKKSAIIPQ